MDDIFCKIIDHKIPANIRFEDGNLIVFDDINPKAPVHLLLVPKKHVESLAALETSNIEIISQIVLKAQELAKQLGLKSFRLVTNSGQEAGQSVPHLHFHLLGGKPLGDIVT